MHGAHHSTCFGCVHEQSWCKQPRQVLGSPSALSSIGENENTVLRKSQRQQKEGDARINKVSAMGSGLANIIEIVRNWRHFQRPETDLHIAENACCINYTDTWSLKRVHWLSKSQSTNRSTIYYGCENTVELNPWVAWVSLPITRIHPRVAQASKIQFLPATLENTKWMDHRQAHLESFKAIPILDPVDVEQAYVNSASRYHCLQWHVRSYGWHYASFA